MKLDEMPEAVLPFHQDRQPASRLITLKRLRLWGLRSTISFLDQGLTSLAGFGISLLLARWMIPEAYGAFAVAFATFLFISGFYNALVLEPLSVLGPSNHSHRFRQYFREQLVIHAILVGGLAAALLGGGGILWLAVPANALAGAFIGSGLALPFVLLVWLARRMCYVLQRPSSAAIGSGIYLASVLAGLFTLRYLQIITPLNVFVLTGISSLLVGGILLRYAVLESKNIAESSDFQWKRAFAENWTYGRWIIASTALNSVASQTQTFFVAAFLGLGAAGIFRAMQLPMLIMVHCLAAAGPLVLPALSYDFGQSRIQLLHQKARFVSLGLGGIEFVFVVLLMLYARRAQHFLFGERYVKYAVLMPVLGLVPVFMGLSMGYAMAMRASQKPQFDLVANAIAAPLALISAVGLLHYWGLAGAAGSMVLGSAVYMICVVSIYHSRSKFRLNLGRAK